MYAKKIAKKIKKRPNEPALSNWTLDKSLPQFVYASRIPVLQKNIHYFYILYLIND
jgi:hypothetical protein